MANLRRDMLREPITREKKIKKEISIKNDNLC